MQVVYCAGGPRRRQEVTTLTKNEGTHFPDALGRPKLSDPDAGPDTRAIGAVLDDLAKCAGTIHDAAMRLGVNCGVPNATDPTPIQVDEGLPTIPRQLENIHRHLGEAANELAHVVAYLELAARETG